MFQTRLSVRLCLAAVLVLTLAPRAHAETVDAYTDALPPHPELSTSHAPILWVGSYCDDLACPPGVPITHESDSATQTGLSGAHDGDRLVSVSRDGGGQLVARVDDASHTLRLTSVATLDELNSISLDYSKLPESLNLAAGGADALAFDISGTGLDGSGIVSGFLYLGSSHHLEIQGVGVPVSGPGTVFIPFALYTSVVDFSDIDYVSLTIYTVGSLDVAIGPLHSTTMATPTVAKTWGAIKHRYR